MNLQLTEEQTLLSDTFSRLFKENSNTGTVRRSEPLGFDQDLWRMLVDMDVPGSRVNEAHGGMALGLKDVSLIAYQAGYHIAPVPLLESVVAAKMLSDIGGGVALNWFDKIMSGRCIVSIASQPVSEACRQIVSAGGIADAVIAFDGKELAIFTDAAAKSEFRNNLGSQPISEWDFKNAKREFLTDGDSARSAYEAAIEEWKLLLAAQLSGICARSLEYAAEYSNAREAFGVKIGTFQGLSHPLAECAIANDGTKLLIDFAIWKLQQGHADAHAYISMAYWWSTETATTTIPKCVHIFGGYGVSVEHDIQLFARRGMAMTAILGDRQQEVLNIAKRLWDGSPVSTPEARSSSIDFSLGSDAEEMLTRVKQFFSNNITKELESYRSHSWDGFHPSIYKKLAAENLLFPHWPKDWGGLEAKPSEQLAITRAFYECRWTEYPQGTSGMVGEMIHKFGSPELKQEVLPLIKSGDAICCLGFTEPHCGSDVFSAKTKARKIGGQWIINGQKMFTSGANIAKYVLLLTNTDPEAPKHVGKTLFLVPMDLPGIEIHRVNTISEDRTHITYYSDVVIDDKFRIGEVDSGSKVMGYMLSLEQGGFPSGFEFKHMVDQAVGWALKTKRNRKRIFDDPLVQMRLAAAKTDLTIAELMLLRITEQREKGNNVRHYGSMLKAFVCEAWKKDSAALIGMAAPYSLISNTDDLSYIEGGWRSSLASAVYGGTTQVHLSVVAEKALGMPRSR